MYLYIDVVSYQNNLNLELNCLLILFGHITNIVQIAYVKLENVNRY